MARDNFSASIKQKLRERVGNKCSNPDCESVTTGPGLEPEKVVHLGDAAHICAASPEGPRYDPTMTSQQRKSISNGIWLCTACARRVDHDKSGFSVDLLLEWKVKAEAKASDEIGKKAIDRTTVSKEIASILTGTPTLSSHVIVSAHTAVTSALEKLDPRFTVDSKFENNRTSFEINTKENVKLKLKIKENSSDDFGLRIKRLLEEGEELKIPGSSILATGSPLLDHVINSTSGSGGVGVLSFSAPLHKALIKVHFENEAGVRVLEIDDIQGHFQSGFKFLKFFGKIFEGLVDLVIKISSEDTRKLKATIDFGLKSWENLNVCELPNIDELNNFCLAILNDNLISVRIKFKGKEVVGAKAKLLELHDLVSNIISRIFYIKRAATLSKILNKPIYYKDSEISEDDFYRLKNYTAQGLPNLTHKVETLPNGVFSSTIVLDADNADQKVIYDADVPLSIMIQEESSSTILVFGQEIILPRKKIFFNGVTPKIKEIIEECEGERTAVVDWIPSNDFCWAVEYSDYQ